MTDSVKITTPIKSLLVSAFLMNAAGFMVIPFLAVYLSKNLDFSPFLVGTVLTTNIVFSRLFPLIGGMLGDRLGHNNNLVIGILVRATGFLGYSLFTSFPMLVVSSIAVGLGGAFYDPSINSIFAHEPEEKRKRIYTYLNQFLNAGAVLGPLIGGALLSLNPQIPFMISAFVFLGVGLILLFYKSQFITPREHTNPYKNLTKVVRHKKFVRYTGVMILFWIMFAQLSVSLPIKFFELTGNETYVSSIFVMNGLSGILLMFLLRKLFVKKSPILLIQLGMLIMGISLSLIGTTSIIYLSLVWVLLFTLGETLILPSSDVAVSGYSDGQNSGIYFGMFDISWAIGGTIGNYLGAWLVEQEFALNPWSIYIAIGLCGYILLGVLVKDKSAEEPSNTYMTS